MGPILGMSEVCNHWKKSGRHQHQQLVPDPYYSHVDVNITLLVRFWEKKLFRVLL